MKFPWHKYDELKVERRNTLQMFITNKCNLSCKECFARNIIKDDNLDMSMDEYWKVLEDFVILGGKQINLIGGEPLLHPDLGEMIAINKDLQLKTTIYTNGYFLDQYDKEDFRDAKLRLSIYSKEGKIKSVESLRQTEIPFDVCYMVSSSTTIDELLDSAKILENDHPCNVFFISSLRELDNPSKEFFDDTENTMPVLDYKRLVHEFLERYEGNMNIHISKRGVFESSVNPTGNKCKFANYFIGGKVIQCPYDIVNSKFQEDYRFDQRYCQHNNTCLMTKIVVRRKDK